RNLEVFVEHDARVVHQHVELREFSFYMRREVGYLRWLRDVALNRVELRVLCFHLIERRLTPASHDDCIVEFEKFEREGKTDAGRASSDENGATSEFHKSSFITEDTNRMVSPKFGY